LNATLLNTNKFATLDVANFTSQEGSMNLTLKGVGDYKVFKHAVFDNSKVALVYDDTLFAAPVWNEANDTITVSMKSVEEIAADTGVKADTAAAVSHIAEAASKSDSVLMQDLSLKMQEKLAGGDVASVEHATKAVHPEKESVVQSVSTSVQNTVVNLASARMATPIVGRSGGDVEFTKGGVWAQGLFNKSKHADSFNGYTRGIAVGMDGTINKDWTVGAGYSFAHSDITGTARNTEIDSNTVFVYGQYKPAEWYVNAILNYAMSDYSERGTVLDGIAIAGDYDVDSFGGALAAGYDFANGITPELGLRYMHVDASDYANSYGIKTSMNDSDFLTGVIGAKYAFDIAATRHLTFAPQLNAALKYDMLSDKNIATVTMPGLDAYTLDGTRLKRIGGEFGIGLGMQYRSLEMSINYDIDVREDYTSQTGMLKFRYNF
jgi:outer membrane autotransporter protein